MVCEDYRHSINCSFTTFGPARSVWTTDGCYPTQMMLEESTGITTLCKKCNHVPRFNQEVIVVGAKSTQAEELALRNSTLAVVKMKRRETEVVVSICFLVEDRGLDLIIRNA